MPVLLRPLIMQRNSGMRFFMQPDWAIHVELLWERPLLRISVQVIIALLYQLAKTRHK